MPERPASRTYLLSPCSGARDAGDDAEDCAESVVDSIDGVADPCTGLLATLVALGKEFIQNGFGIDLGCASRRLIVTRAGASLVRGGGPSRLR